MKHFYFMLSGVFLILTTILLASLLLTTPLLADTNDFTKYEMGFKNFLTCELTRNNAANHFKGKAFKIAMVDLFALQRESDMVIITGTVGCVVGDSYHLLYVAVGVETIMDKEQVTYYTVRKNDFSILATELIQFPYKERCPWSRYFVDTN